MKKCIKAVSIILMVVMLLPALVGCGTLNQRQQDQALFQVFLNLFEWDSGQLNRGNNTSLYYIALDLSELEDLDIDTDAFISRVEEFAQSGERNFTVEIGTLDELISRGFIYQDAEDEEVMRFSTDNGHGLLFSFWAFGTGDTALTGAAADNIPEMVQGNQFRIAGRKWRSNTETRAANITATRDRNNQFADEGFIVNRANPISE